jgi:hypothetical protein
MKQVPDRKKLRRDYLTKRRMVVLGVTEVIFLAVGFLYLVWTARHNGAGIAALLILGLIVDLGAFLIGSEAKHNYNEVRGTYVPPVMPETLPTDEILVRGSEEPPVAHSEVLLRAATGAETPKEELLRVTEGEI